MDAYLRVREVRTGVTMKAPIRRVTLFVIYALVLVTGCAALLLGLTSALVRQSSTGTALLLFAGGSLTAVAVALLWEDHIAPNLHLLADRSWRHELATARRQLENERRDAAIAERLARSRDAPTSMK